MTDKEQATSENHVEQSRQLEQLLIQRQKWLGDASHAVSYTHLSLPTNREV